MSGRPPAPEGQERTGPLYLIHVDGLLHHATSKREDHETYAARLREDGHNVTTEER